MEDEEGDGPRLAKRKRRRSGGRYTTTASSKEPRQKRMTTKASGQRDGSDGQRCMEVVAVGFVGTKSRKPLEVECSPSPYI